MNHAECEICRDVPDYYYYPHGNDEIYSPLFKKLLPLGVEPGDKTYHADFLKCPVCGTYYFYDNWQQGIGNIGEFDEIVRFTDVENRIIKPVLEAVEPAELKKAVIAGIEYENGKLAEKTQTAFECVLKTLPFSAVFPVIKSFMSYKKKWSTPDGTPVNQGPYWACYCLRWTIIKNTATPGPEVHEAIYKCFNVKIEHKNGKWQVPDKLEIQIKE